MLIMCVCVCASILDPRRCWAPYPQSPIWGSIRESSHHTHTFCDIRWNCQVYSFGRHTLRGEEDERKRVRDRRGKQFISELLVGFHVVWWQRIDIAKTFLFRFWRPTMMHWKVCVSECGARECILHGPSNQYGSVCMCVGWLVGWKVCRKIYKNIVKQFRATTSHACKQTHSKGCIDNNPNARYEFGWWSWRMATAVRRRCPMRKERWIKLNVVLLVNNNRDKSWGWLVCAFMLGADQCLVSQFGWLVGWMDGCDGMECTPPPVQLLQIYNRKVQCTNGPAANGPPINKYL